MDRTRIVKFLFGGFALVVVILVLVFSLISGGSQTESAPVLDSSMPAAPISETTAPTEPGTTPAVTTPEAPAAEQPAH